MRICTIAFVAVILILCACSRQLSKLTDRIAAADRVVVVNHSGKFMLSATGDEATKLVRAVSSAKRDRHYFTKIAATFSWRLQFYRGTNLLDVVRFQDRIFLIDGAEYSDDSGVLKALSDKILADPNRPTD